MGDPLPLTSKEFLAEVMRMGPMPVAEFHSLPREIRACIEEEWIRAWLDGRSATETAAASTREELIETARIRSDARRRMLGYGRSLLRHGEGHEGPAADGGHGRSAGDPDTTSS